MTAFHVEKDSYLSVPIFNKKSRIKVVVNVDAYVNVAIFSTSAFGRYETDGEASAEWWKKNRTMIEDIINLPTVGEWIFVIENCSDNTVGGSWEIYE